MQETLSVVAIFGIPAAVMTGIGAWLGWRSGQRRGACSGGIQAAFLGGPMLALLLLGAILPALNGQAVPETCQMGALFIWCAIFWLSHLGMWAPLACGLAYAAVASFGALIGASLSPCQAGRLRAALTVALSSGLLTGLAMSMLPKMMA